MLSFLFVSYVLPGLLRAVRRLVPHPVPPERMPLASRCAALGTRTTQVSDVNDPASQDQLAALNLDLIVSTHLD